MGVLLLSGILLIAIVIIIIQIILIIIITYRRALKSLSISKKYILILVHHVRN